MEFKHVPIMLNECMENLMAQSGKIFIDGTLGGGGHTFEILQKSSPDGIVYGIDRDTDALNAAKERCKEFGDRLITIHGNFMDAKNIVPKKAHKKVDGILLDLGVSSFQLDNAERGFSYMHDAKLDMRMNRDQRLSAYDVINKYDKEKLTDIFYKYGEEKWSKRVAEFICEERKNSPIETTFELVSIIKKAIPKGARKDGPHPATRIFQSIRVEVNGELEKLNDAINDLIEMLGNKGRIAIITFHSLEDRIVKNAFKKAEDPCECSKKLPMCVCGKKPLGKVITRKPILPDENEAIENPRSRSAKLRVFETF